jgi:predicted esterase
VILERTIPARVHGTYLLRPPTDGDPAALLIGFHGYGETARDHLAKLERLPGADRWLLCAVQALHPFYTRSREVVAGWMTKHDRDNAIADNTAYCAAVVVEVHAEHPALAGRLALIGFSQGVAMAYRAAAGAGHPARALVALAGDVPPEVLARDPLELPPVLIAAGRDDEWYGPARMEEEVARLRERGIDARGLAFAGGHEWTEEFYAAAGEFLAERLGGDLS